MSLDRGYVDATVFGEVNKSYLAGMTVIDISAEGPLPEPLEPLSKKFDYHVAREMYEDDPVVQAILKRMGDMESVGARLEAMKGDLQEAHDVIKQMKSEMNYAKMLKRDSHQKKQWWTDKKTEAPSHRDDKYSKPAKAHIVRRFGK